MIVTDKVIPSIFNKLPQSSMIVAVKNYRNNWGEVSNFRIVFHYNYHNAINKSLAVVRAAKPSTYLERHIKENIISSYTQSLTGYNPKARSAHIYDQVSDRDGVVIKGVKAHRYYKELHLMGLLLSKEVLKTAKYPARSKDEQIKMDLLKGTPLSRIRQFKLVEGRFDSLTVSGMTISDSALVKRLS